MVGRGFITGDFSARSWEIKSGVSKHLKARRVAAAPGRGVEMIFLPAPARLLHSQH